MLLPLASVAVMQQSGRFWRQSGSRWTALKPTFMTHFVHWPFGTFAAQNPIPKVTNLCCNHAIVARRK
jgi:hypothetical protein